MGVNVKGWMPTTLDVFSEPVAMEVKRLEFGEYLDFETQFLRFANPAPGVEHAVDVASDSPDYAGAVAMAKATALMGMTPEQRAAEVERAKGEAADLEKFCQSAATYLRFPAEDKDGKPNFTVDDEPVLTGADLLKHFGGQVGTIMKAVSMVWLMNRLPPELGKKYGSPSVSPTTSGKPRRARRGRRQG